MGADGQTACLDRHRVLVHLTRGDGVMNEFCYSSCHPDRKSPAPCRRTTASSRRKTFIRLGRPGSWLSFHGVSVLTMFV